MTKILRVPILISVVIILVLSSCKNAGDARKRPPNVKDRVQKNIEEGRGFTLMGSVKKNNIGEFDDNNINIRAASSDIYGKMMEKLDKF